MAVKSQYITKQRRILTEYLSSMPDRHFTAADICGYFHNCGNPIGTATVYRQLERMVEEGLVAKYVIDENSPACFEYIGEGERCCHPNCYHLKCEVCGRLIHLACDEVDVLKEHIETEHGFRINMTRTVLYGICEACRTETKETAGESAARHVHHCGCEEHMSHDRKERSEERRGSHG